MPHSRQRLDSPVLHDDAPAGILPRRERDEGQGHGNCGFHEDSVHGSS